MKSAVSSGATLSADAEHFGHGQEHCLLSESVLTIHLSLSFYSLGVVCKFATDFLLAGLFKQERWQEVDGDPAHVQRV